MKLIQTLFIITIVPYVINAQCEPSGITTNPDSPVNNQLPGMVNTFFDWRDNEFDINSTKFPPQQTNILSPFNPNAQNFNVYSLSQSQDNKPEDGWELISWDFGYDLDGTPANPPVGIIHFMLYNKYTSTLRLFAAGEGWQGYNSAIITFETEATSSMPQERVQPSLIQHPSLFSGLDKHYEDKIQTVSEFYMITNNWFYADFFINYDPCVCFYESLMKYQIQFVNTANVALTGTLTGQVVTASGGNATTTQNGKSFDLETAISGYNKYKSYYEKGKEFSELIDEVADIWANNDSVIYLPIYSYPESNPWGSNWDYEPSEILSQVQTDFHETTISTNNIFEQALETVPYIGEAFKLIKFFVDATTSTSQSTPKPKPMTITGNVGLTGTITEEHTYGNIIKKVPGSLNSDVNDNTYPFYNEVLGVFNLIETPKIRYNKASYIVSQPNYISSYNYVLNQNQTNCYVTFQQIENFELSTNELKYTFNPALELTDDNVEIMGSLRFEVPYVDESHTYIKTSVYETEMQGLNCLFNTSYTFGGEKEIVINFPHTVHPDYAYQPGNFGTATLIENNNLELYGDGFKLPLDYSVLYNSNIGQSVVILNSNPFSHANDNVFEKYEREYNISLKLLIKITLPDGHQVLMVQTYDLDQEVVGSMTKPASHQQIKPFIRLDEEIELPNGMGNLVIAANNIVIAENANLSALGSSTLTIQAMDEINVLPDAIINPNVVLEIVPKQGCYALPVNVMLTESEVTTFCQSNAYKGIRNKTNLDIIEKPIFAEDNFTFNLFPNPSTADTWLTYSIAEEATVRILITDMMGKIIENSREQVQSAGDYQVQLNTSNLSKGYYHCTLLINGVAQTKKLILQ
jgi:hypothetical protein